MSLVLRRVVKQQLLCEEEIELLIEKMLKIMYTEIIDEH